MFNKDYKATNLIDYLDHFFPSCTLCNDTSYWIDGTLCMCEGNWREGLVTKVNIESALFPFKELPIYLKGTKCTGFIIDDLNSVEYLTEEKLDKMWKKIKDMNIDWGVEEYKKPKPRDDEKDYIDPLVSKYHFKGCICSQCKKDKKE